MTDPYEAGLPDAQHRLHQFVRRVLWRRSKASVEKQLNLPRQEQFITRLTFESIESYLYAQRHQECLNVRSLLCRSTCA